jgi:hypothetical protein
METDRYELQERFFNQHDKTCGEKRLFEDIRGIFILKTETSYLHDMIDSGPVVTSRVVEGSKHRQGNPGPGYV